ncbi:Uncharacterized protein FWK35_00030061, partial [Aphis craccivora]
METLKPLNYKILKNIKSKVSQLEAGCSNSSSLNLEQTLAEISDRHSRSHNIILFNIPESTTQSNLDDKNTISSIFQQIGVLIEPINCLSLGKLSNNCRPLRATLPNQHNVYDVLKNKLKLSDLANFKNISISSDKTLLQRKHLKHLFDELNSRKTADYDIIVLSETWLRDEVNDCELGLLPKYSVFRCDR